METTSLLIGLVVGAILGTVILYFILKSAHVPRKMFDELNNNFIRTSSDFQNSAMKISVLENQYQSEKKTNSEQTEILNQLKNEIAKISAENNSQNQKIAEQQELNQKQSTEIRSLLDEKQNLISIKSQLSAQNES